MEKGCVVGLLLVWSAGCFSPPYGNTACDAEGACPKDYICNTSTNKCIPRGTIPTDAPTDGNNLCFGSFVNVCLDKLPTEPLELTNGDLFIDTGSDSRCNSGTTNYCVIAAIRLSIAANLKLRAYGARPLILISTSNEPLQLSGEIDVGSHPVLQNGPTASGAGAKTAAACLSLTPAPSPATGTSGGFGGSFGGSGGDGEATDGAEGRASAAIDFPSNLRGGCPGGDGANGTSGGQGGSGGGAILIVASSIQLNGKINASGAGGQGGTPTKSGGGGGGSGGMIVIEANPIAGNGIMFANGGGGGQGGSPAVAGDSGGESSGPHVQALGGGNITKDGGHGGDGSAGVIRHGSQGDSAQNQGGGGGGGGGAGFIRAGVVSGVVFAPPLTP